MEEVAHGRDVLPPARFQLLQGAAEFQKLMKEGAVMPERFRTMGVRIEMERRCSKIKRKWPKSTQPHSVSSITSARWLPRFLRGCLK